MIIVSIILIIIGFLLSTIGSYITIYLIPIGLISLLIGIIALMKLSTKKYEWECSNCHYKFKISLKDNIKGINEGINRKSLICPNCHKNNVCIGHRIEI